MIYNLFINNDALRGRQPRLSDRIAVSVFVDILVELLSYRFRNKSKQQSDDETSRLFCGSQVHGHYNHFTFKVIF